MTNETAASSVLASMGSGSGIDIIKLARDLSNAEKAPQEARLTDAKERSEAKISAISVLKYNVDQFIGKLNGLNDAAEITSAAASSSNTNAATITASGSPIAGTYDLNITAVAAVQRNASSNYASMTTSINGGSAFTMTLTTSSGSVDIAIEAGKDSVEEVAKAINQSGTGYKASALATGLNGTDVKLVLEGPSGSASAFSVSASATADNGAGALATALQSGKLQDASNASFTINGVPVSRPSNTFEDVISGASISLESVGTTSIKVESDRSTLKTRLKDLVQSYNDVQVALTELSDPDSQEELVGGALSRDKALIRSVKDALYQAVTATSSVTSGNVAALRDIGVSITRTGDLSFDEARYDKVAKDSFSDISNMLTAGTTDQSQFDVRPQGLAFDAIKRLDVLTDRFTGLFVRHTSSEQQALARTEEELVDLEASMEKVYQRYLSQFSLMESLVSSLNSTRESMSTTWKNMADSYNQR